MARIDELQRDKLRESSSTFTDGLARGLDSYAKEATDSAKAAESAISSFASNSEDALVDLFTKGKASASDFANAVIADFARIAIRSAITGPIAQGLGGLFGDLLPSAKGNVFANAPALSAYSGSIVEQPTLFPFAKGGAVNMGLMGEAGAEGIFPLRRNSRGELGIDAQGSGQNIHIEQHLHLITSGGSPEQNQDLVDKLMPALERSARDLVRNELLQQRRSGGLLS